MSDRRALNYFRHPDFPRLDVKSGVLRSRGGTRFIALTEDFLRGFVAACEHETGPAAALVLRRCGEFFGARLARATFTPSNACRPDPLDTCVNAFWKAEDTGAA